MITWFDENRVEMLRKVCDKVLSAELYGHMSVDDIAEALEVLESFKENVKCTPENDKSDEWDLASEMSQAIVAETVQILDANLMDNFILKYRLEKYDLDLEGRSWESGGFQILIDKILTISQMFGDGNVFIVCSPAILSFMQATNTTQFKPWRGKPFRGFHNTMLVGDLDEIPVYSYLHTTDADTTVIGNYNPKRDVCQTRTLTVRNITF